MFSKSVLIQNPQTLLKNLKSPRRYEWLFSKRFHSKWTQNGHGKTPKLQPKTQKQTGLFGAAKEIQNPKW